MTATPSLEDREIIDTFCERFELAWNSGSEPEIRDFLSGTPLRLRNPVLLELLQIDLERRWRASANGSSLGSSVVPQEPLLDDYVAAFPELGEVEQLPPEAVVTEFRVRWNWGDRPGLEQYVTRLGDRAALSIPGLRAALNEFTVESPADEVPELDSSVSSKTRDSTIFQRRTTIRPEQSQSPQQQPLPSPDESLAMLSPGDKVDGYLLHEKLGFGGCGVVFRAQRLNAPGKSFALKVVRPDRLMRRKVAARFEQEVQIARELSHPNIVAAPDSGQWRGLSYLVMEFVSGMSLDHLAKQPQGLSIPTACEVVRQAALGLQYLHKAGYMHRDLKPSNLMLSHDGVVKIVDFGMAGLKEPNADGERLTSIGEAMGTPDYMAPEQWSDARTVDIRADIYSLGCTLFGLLTGDTLIELEVGTRIFAQAQARARPPQDADVTNLETLRPELSPELVAILQRCVEQQAERRYSVPAELAEALEPFCHGAELDQLLPPDADLLVSFVETRIVSRTPDASLDAGPDATSLDENEGTRVDGLSDSPSALLQPSLEQTAQSQSDVPQTAELGEMTRWEKQRDELVGVEMEATVKERPSMTSSRSQTTLGKTVVLRQREVSKTGAVSIDGAEFELGEELGKGGMGLVYRARQGAVDRAVAVKVIQPKLRNNEDIKNKFVTEAVVTSDLEHPGIIPIYDLGTNADGEVFYAMKEVRGSEWKKTIGKNSESENLDILLRVADAIAFAHERGIVHRDLKPENIMLGRFGEVLVMDWGLALPTADYPKQGLAFSEGAAGTPAYMAPEMAAGNMQLIGPASDIYLLGGLLFKILTGKAPHSGRDAWDCMRAASRNVIVATDRNDELMLIALRALATLPQDRFASVQDFQAAIVEYRKHAESLRLTDIAEDEYLLAVEQSEYPHYEDAIAAFRNAGRLWDGNDRAREGLIATQLDYAKLAFKRRDLDLAAHQLDAGLPKHAELSVTVQVARQERDAQRERARRMKRIALQSVALVFVIISVAGLLVDRSRRQEQQARADALKYFQEAETAISRLTGISQDLENFPRLGGVRQNLLEMVAKYYSELNERRSADPDLQLASAQANLRLGDVYALLADQTSAEAAFAKSIDSAVPLTAAAQRQDVRDEATLVLLKGYAKLGQSQRAQGKHAAADASIATGLGLESGSQTPAITATRGDLFLQRTQLHRDRGRWGEAIQDIARAQELYDLAATGGDETLQQRCRVSVALSCDQLALVEEQAGHLERAEQAARRAIGIWSKLLASDEANLVYREGSASSHVLLGNIQRGFGRNAEPTALAAISDYERLVTARPEVPRYQFNLATELANLAYMQLRSGKTPESLKTAINATNLLIRLVNQYPDEIDYANGDASSLSILGEILRDRGEVALAAEKLDDAITYFDARSSSAPDVTSYRLSLAECLCLRAQTAELAAQPGDSCEYFERALEVLESSPMLLPGSVPSPHHGDLVAWIHQHLVDAAWLRGEPEVSRTHTQAALKMRAALPKSPDLQHHFGWSLCCGLDTESRDPRRAVEFLKQAASSAETNADYWFDLAFAQTQTRQWSDVALSLEQAQKCSAPARGQWELVQSLVEREQGRTQVADDLLRQGSELLALASPGNPRLRRLKLLVTPAR